MHFPLVPVAVVLAALARTVVGESHTVHFDNRQATCGFGTPTLIQGPIILSTGADFTSSGPLIEAIAYLQTGSCGFNGENCTVVETTLVNPTSPGSLTSSDISLIPPHAFSVTTGFGYYNGCDGDGADCDNPECPAASHNTGGQFPRPVPCLADNVNLVVTFCDEA